MLLLKFYGCIILAAVIEFALFYLIAEFFRKRFFEQADAIFLLYEYIYPMIEDNFNSDNEMKVSATYEYCGRKIKFHNALEASLKFEILAQKALKNYYIAEYFLDLLKIELDELEMDECKEQLEEYCLELRTLISKNTKKNYKGL